MNYNGLADDFAETHIVNIKIFYELISYFNPRKHIKVLDFGCGTGNYLYAINAKTSYKVYGVEPSDEMKLYAKHKNPNISIKRGNHQNIPYPDEFFEYIYMTNVVHHVEDINQMYKEFLRVLKPNGIVCICTENRLQLLNKFWIKYFPSIILADLKRFPSISTLKRCARKNGLSVLKTTEIWDCRRTTITDFLMKQVTRRSMSVLNLIPDKEYLIGKKKMLRDKIQKKKYISNRGYTFLWLQKRGV